MASSSGVAARGCLRLQIDVIQHIVRSHACPLLLLLLLGLPPLLLQLGSCGGGAAGQCGRCCCSPLLPSAQERAEHALQRVLRRLHVVEATGHLVQHL